MSIGDGHIEEFGELSATEALAVVVGELRGVRLELARLDGIERELARLRDAVRRPERILYRPVEAARRLGVGKTMVYKLWNNGQLAFRKDNKGRYSTEAQIQAYLRDAHFVHSA